MNPRAATLLALGLWGTPAAHAQALPDAPPPAAVDAPHADTGIIPGLNLYLPEGEADIRLSKLIKNSLFETEFAYAFVSGDISAFLRYKYYGVKQSLTISGFDKLSFRSIESFSLDYDRVRGLNVLVRRPVSYQRRFSLLAEVDRLSFSNAQQNLDNRRTNVFVKVGYQYGIGEDIRSNQVFGDPNDRIRNLFTVHRDMGPGGRGFSAAVTYGIPVGAFEYVKAEGEALQVLDLPGNKRIVGRIHAGFFPYKPFGPLEESSAGRPYRIPGGEYFRLDGRENLKGSRDAGRDVNEIHLTLEGFFPVFINRNASFLKLSWNTLYGIGYAGTGNLGESGRTFTRLGDYRQDLGLGFEVSFSYRKYQVFVSGLVAKVLQESGSPRFLFSLRSAN